jgi:L-lactate dehydrogenase complex protein LldF
MASATFYTRVDDALKNKALGAAMDSATKRLVAGRQAGMAAFPEAETVRDHARAIRAHTIGQLGGYLRQFEAAVRARGGHVHWAQTAEQAVAIVADIARQHDVRRAVKSKSMVSEEIDLNAALARAGVDVLETDLGEFVVQIDKDHPSHIVAPIIHKSRHDVATSFRALGATDEDLVDVPQMTAFARRLLRAGFFKADMGISGGNFGVAETGSICICTNEGNGRLTTTVPRVHVALMGIERLVPTLSDLGVMLQLLGRSATGQKLTVYTNIITGQRRSGAHGASGGERAAAAVATDLSTDAASGAEADGPEHLHIVLVDNGRSGLLGGELAEILYCIRCGACLNVCPVYQQVGGHAYGSVYPGPVGAVLTPGLRGLSGWEELPQASSLCGACREVCPVRIDIPRMLLSLRAESTRLALTPAWVNSGLWLLGRLAERPRMFRAAQTLAARATRLVARNGWIRWLPGHLSAWTRERDFPAFASRTFMQRWERTRR